MSFSFGSKISTDGLVLFIDFLNKDCYVSGSNKVVNIIPTGSTLITGSITGSVIPSIFQEKGLLLNSPSQSILFGNIFNEIFAGTDNQFSICTFFYPLTSSNGLLVGKTADSNAGENQRQYALVPRDLGQGFKMEIVNYFTLTGTQYRVTRSQTTLQTGSWNYFAHSYNGAIDTNNGLDRIRMVVNGISSSVTMSDLAGALSGTIPAGTGFLFLVERLDQQVEYFQDFLEV